MSKQTWAKIPFTDLFLEASKYGRIRNGITKHIIKTYVRKSGYESFIAGISGKRNTAYVHRCVLSAHSPIHNWENLHIHHKDHNPSNNSLTNLVWCTVSENLLYSLRDGRLSHSIDVARKLAKKKMKDGTHHLLHLTKDQIAKRYKNRKGGFAAHNIKMTPEKLKIITEFINEGYSVKEICKKTGFSRSVIYGIRNNKIKY